MVEESYGVCTKCVKEGILGDGLCESCWDARENGVSRPRDIAEESLIDRLLGPSKKVVRGAKFCAIREDTQELQQVISEALSFITEQQRRVIVMRFGLDGKRYTLEKIGQEFGVTRERIRQIEARALRRLQWQANFGGVSRKLKAHFVVGEPLTHGELLLKSIFNTKARRRNA